MFHKVKSVTPKLDYNLIVQFSEGVTKSYCIEKLFDKLPAFIFLKENPEYFFSVKVDAGGYGISWTDDLDLSSDELWKNGKTIKLLLMDYYR